MPAIELPLASSHRINWSGLLVAWFAVLSGATLLQRDASAEDWPQFRGPNSSGISSSTKPLPVEFSATQNVRWSANVGEGIGSPVVAAGHVYTTSMVGDDKFAVYCFDTVTGKNLWTTKVPIPIELLPKITAPNCHASSSPAADAQRVYVYVSTLGLLAFDAANGKQLWHLKMPVPYFVFDWGPAASPVLYEDLVLFNQDDDLNPALWAVDRATGEVRWRTERNEMLASYSHPVICRTPERDEIIVAGTGKLIAYDPANGRQLWYARVLLRNIKTTPATRDGVVYVSLESGGIADQWIAANDKDKDGKLSRDEVPAPLAKKFERGDINQDGFLEGAELDKAFLDPENVAGAQWNAKDPMERYILAVRGGGTGDVTKTHVLWKHPSRAPSGITSPLVVADRMFIVKNGGLSSCFKTETGDPLWSLSRINNIGDFYASPVTGDGKIYVTGENGIVSVLENGPSAKPLAANDMGESCVATPAIADGHLFIRTRNHLYCVGE